jgi:hypothetical protein
MSHPETDLEETFRELRQEVLGAAADNRDFMLNEFLHAFGRELEEAGEIESLTPAYHEARGVRIDAFAQNGDEGIDLFVADFSDRTGLETITRTEVMTLIGRLTSFYKKAVQEDLYRGMEEASDLYYLARTLAERSGQLGRVRFYLLSERKLSDQFRNFDIAAESGGRPITLHIWDISRLHRLRSSRSNKEPIEIDFLEISDRTVPCLPAHVGGDAYSAYLLAMPGNVRADLYKRFGARLMEQNVRAFLQATNASNRGIRETILREPEMFFAYNNGVTATAASIELEEKDGIPHIRRISDLQIVNGGQTTASLFHARRKDRADLSRIFVQMKLSIIEQSRVEETVPRISQYANTQSRINAADFFSNHPFHVRVEEFSRRIWAPAHGGEQLETHWFYERTRGQYREQQAQKSPAEKRLFLRQFPRDQLIRKTDLAKYENCWDEHPRYVNLGAEKNFAQFARRIGGEWKDDPARFDEAWYRRMVARTILFRRLEKIVSAQPWFNGGYRANIVAYTIAMLSRALARNGQSLDHETIWKAQGLDAPLEKLLAGIAAVANEQLSGSGRAVSNVTEWAKKEECWEHMKRRDGDIDLLLGSARLTASPSGRRDGSEAAGDGAAKWREIKARADELGLLSPKSDAALAKLIAGTATLTSSESNALSYLMQRLGESDRSSVLQ